MSMIVEWTDGTVLKVIMQGASELLELRFLDGRNEEEEPSAEPCLLLAFLEESHRELDCTASGR